MLATLMTLPLQGFSWLSLLQLILERYSPDATLDDSFVVVKRAGCVTVSMGPRGQGRQAGFQSQDRTVALNHNIQQQRENTQIGPR